jgi:hypothetical protein
MAQGASLRQNTGKKNNSKREEQFAAFFLFMGTLLKTVLYLAETEIH